MLCNEEMRTGVCKAVCGFNTESDPASVESEPASVESEVGVLVSSAIAAIERTDWQHSRSKQWVLAAIDQFSDSKSLVPCVNTLYIGLMLSNPSRRGSNSSSGTHSPVLVAASIDCCRYIELSEHTSTCSLADWYRATRSRIMKHIVVGPIHSPSCTPDTQSQH